MTEIVEVSRAGGVATWTLNLPEKRNPISGAAMLERLLTLLEEAHQDPSLRAVVLTGAGSAFSSGGDVTEMTARTGMFAAPPMELRRHYEEGIQALVVALFHSEVPIVAAVNGPAVGAGLDLALLCDIRVASTRAVFAESFVRIGLVPGDGGAWLLPRAVGASRAAHMALTGDRIDARTALDWGIVTRVEEPEDLMSSALEVAERLAANPRTAVRLTKRLLRRGQTHSLADSLDLAASLQALAHQDDEHVAAVAALADRIGSGARRDA